MQQLIKYESLLKRMVNQEKLDRQRLLPYMFLKTFAKFQVIS